MCRAWNPNQSQAMDLLMRLNIESTHECGEEGDIEAFDVCMFVHNSPSIWRAALANESWSMPGWPDAYKD